MKHLSTSRKWYISFQFCMYVYIYVYVYIRTNLSWSALPDFEWLSCRKGKHDAPQTAKQRWNNVGSSSLIISAQRCSPMWAQCDFAYRSNIRPTCWFHVGPTYNNVHKYFGLMWSQCNFNAMTRGPRWPKYTGIWFCINPASQMTINSLKKLTFPHFVFCLQQFINSVSRSIMAF